MAENIGEQLSGMLTTMIGASVVANMSENLDVTDDVLGRNAYAGLCRHLGDDRGPATDALRAVATPIKVTEWAGNMAGKIRITASLAVAAALDEDPGASEARLGLFVAHSLREKCGSLLGAFNDELLLGFGTQIARMYSAMVRRSGLPPEQWAVAFHNSVVSNHWAFRRT